MAFFPRRHLAVIAMSLFLLTLYKMVTDCDNGFAGMPDPSRLRCLFGKQPKKQSLWLMQSNQVMFFLLSGLSLTLLVVSGAFLGNPVKWKTVGDGIQVKT